MLMRCLATGFVLFFVCAERTVAEVVTRTGTVEEVTKDQLILLQEGTVYAVNAKTQYVKKTADGLVKAKLGDLKEGTEVEIQVEKGKRIASKVIILKAKQ